MSAFVRERRISSNATFGEHEGLADEVVAAGRTGRGLDQIAEPRSDRGAFLARSIGLLRGIGPEVG